MAKQPWIISHGRFTILWPGLVFAGRVRSVQQGVEGVVRSEPHDVGELASLVEQPLLSRVASVLRWRRGTVDALVIGMVFVGLPVMLVTAVSVLEAMDARMAGARAFLCCGVLVIPVSITAILLWQSRSAARLLDVLRTHACPWCDYQLGLGTPGISDRCPECGGERHVTASGIPEWARGG